MSRKNVSLPFALVTDGDMSGDITSSEININFLDNVGIELAFTGTPTGTFTVEVSVSGNNWSALDFGTPIAASGVAGNHQLNINQAPFSKIRVKYVRTSGTGVLNVTAMAKEL